MLRYLLILMMVTTPCFAQGLGYMGTFGGMGSSSQDTFQAYGNRIPDYGGLSQQGNTLHSYENYLPQVSDYLKQDPRRFSGNTNLMPGQGSHDYKMRKYNKFRQFDYSIPPY